MDVDPSTGSPEVLPDHTIVISSEAIVNRARPLKSSIARTSSLY
jgi:hypothetical protein